MKISGVLSVTLEEEEKKELETAFKVMNKYLEAFKGNDCNGYFEFYKALQNGQKALAAIYSGSINNRDF